MAWQREHYPTSTSCSARSQIWKREAPLTETVMNRSSSIKDEFAIGCRVEIKSSAGPRLSGKTGTVIGIGYHPESLRILLDGSKSPITLHFTYLVVVNK